MQMGGSIASTLATVSAASRVSPPTGPSRPCPARAIALQPVLGRGIRVYASFGGSSRWEATSARDARCRSLRYPLTQSHRTPPVVPAENCDSPPSRHRAPGRYGGWPPTPRNSRKSPAGRTRTARFPTPRPPVQNQTVQRTQASKIIAAYRRAACWVSCNETFSWRVCATSSRPGPQMTGSEPFL